MVCQSIIWDGTMISVIKNFDLSVTMRGAFGFQNINFTRLHYENYRDQAMNNLKAGYEKSIW